MKVKVEMTLDIDVDAWVEAFDLDRKEVREDVRTYVLIEVEEGLKERGFLVSDRHGKVGS